MNRCARLIEKEILKQGNWDAPSYELEIQKGDEMTGFEIIAQLPVEDQVDIGNVISLMSAIRAKTFYSAEDFYDALAAFYKWNSKEWEAIE